MLQWVQLFQLHTGMATLSLGLIRMPRESLRGPAGGAPNVPTSKPCR